MNTGRSIAAAGAFLEGATPLLILCAFLSPFVYPLTVGVGYLLLIPLSCAGPTLLGMRAAEAVWREGTDQTAGKRLPIRSWQGYILGAACLMAYLLLLGIAVAHRGGMEDFTTYAIAFVVYPMLPAMLVYLGLFYGVLLAAPLEILAGSPEARETKAVTASRSLGTGFGNGGITLFPAFLATMFEFTVGQAWRHADTDTRISGATPLPAILLETGRGFLLLAVLWLHQTIFLLLLARYRAARGGVTVAPPAYLRWLCLLASLIFGILVATLICASRTPG